MSRRASRNLDQGPCRPEKPFLVRIEYGDKAYFRKVKPFPQQAMLSGQAGVMGGIGGQIEGLSRERSAFAMGQGAGAIEDVKPLAQIIREIMQEAEEVIARIAGLAKKAASA